MVNIMKNKKMWTKFFCKQEEVHRVVDLFFYKTIDNMKSLEKNGKTHGQNLM